MKCQTCGIRDPAKFATSVLICEQCLFNKQIAAYTSAQIKNAKKFIQKQLDEAFLYGTDIGTLEPKGILNASTSTNSEPITLEKLMDLANQMKIVAPPTAWNCTSVAPPYDSIEMTRQIRASQLRDFAREMQQPIHIDQDFTQYLADVHFDNTMPLLENAILPIPL